MGLALKYIIIKRNAQCYSSLLMRVFKFDFWEDFLTSYIIMSCSRLPLIYVLKKQNSLLNIAMIHRS